MGETDTDATRDLVAHEGTHCPSGRLVVRELMRDQSPADRIPGAIVTCAEENVAANGVRVRPHGVGRLSRFASVVDSHVSEVEPKPRLQRVQ